MRFRDSWMIRTGMVITILGITPVLALAIAYWVFDSDKPAGPMGIWAFCGISIGFLLILLGIAQTVFQKREKRKIQTGPS